MNIPNDFTASSRQAIHADPLWLRHLKPNISPFFWHFPESVCVKQPVGAVRKMGSAGEWFYEKETVATGG